MASFWDRVVTEHNVAKALQANSLPQSLMAQEDQVKGLQGDAGLRQKLGKSKEREAPAPEAISYKTFAHCLLGSPAVLDKDEATKCWEELGHILQGCSRIPHLCHVGPSSTGSESVTAARQGQSPAEQAQVGTTSARSSSDVQDAGPSSAGSKSSAGELPSHSVANEKQEKEIAHDSEEALRERVEAILAGSCSAGPGDDLSQCRAFARKLFVSALAEWVNMHDLHKPFPLGPPSKEQSCATVENEHSKQERVSCNKLFPRKCLAPGCEEIAEDPRRRELFRLWLARNCNFINNYAPLVIFALLSNMDFQATLTKDAVIEYMTKYMTKSGQASLVRVMEHSFSMCIEKTKEKNQGAGAAVLRWFNLQSISEVKSQLETMHLLFKVPRFICSREFKNVWLRSEVRLAKTADQIEEAGSIKVSLASRSATEAYVARDSWEVPDKGQLQSKHAVTRRPLWQEILRSRGVPFSDGHSLDDHFQSVQSQWASYLKALSLWQFKRYFNRAGSSVRCKPFADIVVMSPAPRFTTARQPSQWLDACRWMLLAYCRDVPCQTAMDHVGLWLVRAGPCRAGQPGPLTPHFYRQARPARSPNPSLLSTGLASLAP